MSRYYAKPVQYPLRSGHENKLLQWTQVQCSHAASQRQPGRLEADAAIGSALMQFVVNLARACISL